MSYRQIIFVVAVGLWLALLTGIVLYIGYRWFVFERAHSGASAAEISGHGHGHGGHDEGAEQQPKEVIGTLPAQHPHF